MAEKQSQRAERAALSPVQIRQQRQAIIDRVHGMWRNRKPDPIKELAKMRREWDR